MAKNTARKGFSFEGFAQKIERAAATPVARLGLLGLLAFAAACDTPPTHHSNGARATAAHEITLSGQQLLDAAAGLRNNILDGQNVQVKIGTLVCQTNKGADFYIEDPLMTTVNVDGQQVEVNGYITEDEEGDLEVYAVNPRNPGDPVTDLPACEWLPNNAATAAEQGKTLTVSLAQEQSDLYTAADGSLVDFDNNPLPVGLEYIPQK